MNNMNINQGFQGFYKIGEVNPKTNEVKWYSDGWQKNLILNQGMDNLYNSSVVDQMLYGICGFGTRPNSFQSGLSQITQSGATIYLSNATGNITDFTSSAATYPSRAQVGDMLVYANNSQSQVTAVTNGFNLQVTPSYTFSTGQSFTVWKTSQTSLQTEVSRSIVNVVGAGNCGTTITANSASHLRSYDFPVQGADATFNELGIAWASSGIGTTFSRILLSSPITINAGFNLRLVYTLQVTYFPISSVSGPASIGGWPVGPSVNTNGSQSIQNLLISTVNVSDSTSNTTNAVLEPYFVTVGSGYFSMFASVNSSSLASFGSAIDRRTSYATGGYGQASKSSYTAGNYYCDRTSVLSVGTMGSNSIRSIGFGVGGIDGGNSADNSHQAYCFVFDQPQTLLNTQTLSLTFRTSWSRILG